MIQLTWEVGSDSDTQKDALLLSICCASFSRQKRGHMGDGGRRKAPSGCGEESWGWSDRFSSSRARILGPVGDVECYLPWSKAPPFVGRIF